jgi:hypothetical protein
MRAPYIIMIKCVHDLVNTIYINADKFSVTYACTDLYA